MGEKHKRYASGRELQRLVSKAGRIHKMSNALEDTSAYTLGLPHFHKIIFECFSNVLKGLPIFGAHNWRPVSVYHDSGPRPIPR